MTNIVKDYYLNDFEAGYMSVIKRTIAPLGNTDYLLAKESPTSTQSLKIESTSERNPGIKMIGATRDLRKIKTLNFWLKVETPDINKGYVRFEDVNGLFQDIPFTLEKKWSMARNKNRQKKELDQDKLNLKFVTGISVVLNNEKEVSNVAFLIDDIKVYNQYPTLMNYVIVWTEDMFGRYIINSVIISVVVVLANLLFSSMVAYAFARREFKGKNFLFGLILATMMIPFQVTTIPIFILMKNLNFLDTYWALILPQLVTPFGIFILKQYIEQLPLEIEQAAVVDGAGPFAVFFLR